MKRRLMVPRKDGLILPEGTVPVGYAEPLPEDVERAKKAAEVVDKVQIGHKFYIGNVQYEAVAIEEDGAVTIRPCGLTRDALKKIRRAMREFKSENL